MLCSFYELDEIICIKPFCNVRHVILVYYGRLTDAADALNHVC